MPKELSYTIEEVSQLLKVSKLTLYDLVKKGELPVFRVGRQMRIDANDLDTFIHREKRTDSTKFQPPVRELNKNRIKDSAVIVISGQDFVLDILGKYVEKRTSFKTLRSYTGSLNGLISMYNEECDIVSLHMFDGDTGEYNLPYTKKILVGYPYVLLNLLSRKAGLYVKKGNPFNLTSWGDLNQDGITIVNREKGSGARILLDEQLRLNEISARNIKGYDHEETNHLSVASAVASGHADVGVGIEKVAKMAGIDFVPLITERYDLVILKSAKTEHLISVVKKILSSSEFQSEVHSLGDYDILNTGTVYYDSF
ncbi:substrate-binding domain-containing protein [Mesobacillus zeae]|uniref:Helix-turn-helix domain-containing protein n=1 Tax=Mesobacillus zeae TaxID=1917180 RepID=A0A398AX49_9BACI|nr:helix-turn-helix transcriptional regulator [Mesobacillus zeae]RID82227.1 helix-turn-helix domain-containing protein [Mesobacillus zeae]